MIWLVLWNIWMIFPIILGTSSSHLTNSYILQRGSYTTNPPVITSTVTVIGGVFFGHERFGHIPAMVGHGSYPNWWGVHLEQNRGDHMKKPHKQRWMLYQIPFKTPKKNIYSRNDSHRKVQPMVKRHMFFTPTGDNPTGSCGGPQTLSPQATNATSWKRPTAASAKAAPDANAEAAKPSKPSKPKPGPGESAKAMLFDGSMRGTERGDLLGDIYCNYI